MNKFAIIQAVFFSILFSSFSSNSIFPKDLELELKHVEEFLQNSGLSIIYAINDNESRHSKNKSFQSALEFLKDNKKFGINVRLRYLNCSLIQSDMHIHHLIKDRCIARWYDNFLYLNNGEKYQKMGKFKRIEIFEALKKHLSNGRSFKDFEYYGPNVHVLTNETFFDFIKHQEFSFIHMGASWSGHCKHSSTPFSGAADGFERGWGNVIEFAYYDCYVNDHRHGERNICAEYEVKGYPTFNFFYNFGENYERHDGVRDVEGFASFAIDRIKHYKLEDV